MNRFLLFDAGCATCTELARAIEREAAGWLTAQSLREPAVPALLDRARPGWRWEPMFLEVDGERVQSFTGAALVVRLPVGLGPHRVWRVARLAWRARGTLRTMDLGRRRLLQRSGALLASLVLLGWPKSWQVGPGLGDNASSSSGTSGGEPYAGFLLLPEGAPVPPFVHYPERGIPIMCGVGVGRGGPVPTAVTRNLNTPADLAREVHFPVYTLSLVPAGLRFTGAYLIQYMSGDIFAAWVNFASYNAATGHWEGTVSISAQPDFPRPFPIWSSQAVEPGGTVVALEKVDLLPSPGLMVATRRGYVFHWIQNDVLCALMAEHSQSREEARALVASLVRVGR
ncbi:MAG: hypothetical protein AB1566_12815 [Chloroflexota bacterium]